MGKWAPTVIGHWPSNLWHHHDAGAHDRRDPPLPRTRGIRADEGRGGHRQHRPRSGPVDAPWRKARQLIPIPTARSA